MCAVGGAGCLPGLWSWDWQHGTATYGPAAPGGEALAGHHAKTHWQFSVAVPHKSVHVSGQEPRSFHKTWFNYSDSGNFPPL